MTRIFPRAVLIAIAAAAFAAPVADGHPGRQSAPTAGPALVSREVPFEYTAKGGAGSLLNLETGVKGGVQISAWKKRSILIEARIEINAPTEADLDIMASAVTVSVDENPAITTVRTSGPHDRASMKGVKDFPGRLKTMPYSVDYVIWVPEYTGLDITVADGETVIDGINGIQAIRSLRGPVRLSGVSGTVLLTALDGSVDVTVRDRFWRGPGLDVASGKGDVTFTAPKAFSTSIDAAGTGGVFLDNKLAKKVTALETVLGSGGSRVKLAAAAGKVSITLVEDAPPPEAETESQPEAEPGDQP